VKSGYFQGLVLPLYINFRGGNKVVTVDNA